MLNVRSSSVSALLWLALFALLAVTPAGAQSPASRPAESFAMLLTEGIAPCTVHVSACDTPLQDATKLTAKYEWDFGDKGSAFNELRGWSAAHTFDKPGQYPITLTITDEKGQKRTFTKTITVRQDSRRAIYVSAGGNDSFDGTTPARAVRTFSRATRLVADDTRLLFRRGDTFSVEKGFDLRSSNVVIGAWQREKSQNEANPVLTFAGDRRGAVMINLHQQSRDVVIEDVTFDSIFTKDTDEKGMPVAIRACGQVLTVRRCQFRNLGYALNCNGNPRGMMVQDCTAPLETGLRGYFSWVEGSDHVYLGNTVANSTRQHCLRIGGADRILIAGNDFSNLDRKSVDPFDTTKPALTIHKGSHVYITGNTIRKGEIGIGPLGNNDGLKYPESRWKYAVVEDNLINSLVQVFHGTSGVMCRNNTINRNDWIAFIVQGYDSTYQRGSGDITIANNFVTNRGARGAFLRVTGKVDGITLRENTYIAPKVAPDGEGSGAVCVYGQDLSSFREIARNIWPVPGESGKMFYIGPSMVKQWAYLTPEQWLKLPPVKGDQFKPLKPQPTTQPATVPAK